MLNWNSFMKMAVTDVIFLFRCWSNILRISGKTMFFIIIVWEFDIWLKIFLLDTFSLSAYLFYFIFLIFIVVIKRKYFILSFCSWIWYSLSRPEDEFDWSISVSRRFPTISYQPCFSLHVYYQWPAMNHHRIKKAVFFVFFLLLLFFGFFFKQAD